MLNKYVTQVRLLLSVLPDIAREAVFALKGGTAGRRQLECRCVLQYLHQKAQAAWPTLTMEGLLHELGQIQRIDLLYPPLGKQGPPQVATITSKQTRTQAALVSELEL